MSPAGVRVAVVGSVDLDLVARVRSFPRAGENVIVVAPLADADLDPAHVRAELDRTRPGAVLVQYEVAAAVLEEAAAWCREHDARSVLNASPVREVPERLLAASDPLVVNAAEGLALLRAAEARRPVGTAGERTAGREGGAWRPADVARRLLEQARSVVVTAGGAGAFVADADGVDQVPSTKRVVALDTTGAGDEFAGVLAAELAGGASLRDASAAANDAAGDLVQVPRSQR